MGKVGDGRRQKKKFFLLSLFFINGYKLKTFCETSLGWILELQLISFVTLGKLPSGLISSLIKYIISLILMSSL